MQVADLIVKSAQTATKAGACTSAAIAPEPDLSVGFLLVKPLGRALLKSKIHRRAVFRCQLHYESFCTTK